MQSGYEARISLPSGGRVSIKLNGLECAYSRVKIILVDSGLCGSSFSMRVFEKVNRNSWDNSHLCFLGLEPYILNLIFLL